jgi:hypothetical protein
LTQSEREFTLRFAVLKDDQIASSIWRVWKGRNNDNIYIAPRNIAGSLKVSLHESLHCHVATTTQQWRAGSEATLPRPVMTSWYRPETPNGAIVIVASLLIAPDFLSPWGNATDQSVHLLDTPDIGRAYYFNFIFCRVQPIEMELGDNATVLGQVQLTSGEHFMVIKSLIDFAATEFVQTVNFDFPVDRVNVLTDVGGPGLRIFTYSDPNETEILQMADIGGAALGQIRLAMPAP